MRCTVREYARLTTENVEAASLDEAHIPPSAFDWLSECCLRYPGLGCLRSRNQLQLAGLVGVLTTPCGLELEILPKTQHEADRAPEGRRQLLRMLTKILHAKPVEISSADVCLFEKPLTEWVARQFLLHMHALFKKGLRCDYTRVEEESPFLRGQLNVHRQVRQLPHRRHLFHVRHDLFHEDRPENRLLRSALDRIVACTRWPDNWRLASLLLRLTSSVPASRDIHGDFGRWSDDRLMASYTAVRPWCELVLGKDMPYAVAGAQQGISMLFSMDMLFEQYVAEVLAEHLAQGARLERKPRRSLCLQNGKRSVALEPDIVVHACGKSWVLDTKWKRIDQDSGPRREDIFQMYAYGRQWLHGQGDVVLVYPYHELFPRPQPLLEFVGESMRLVVAAFDLDCDRLYADASCADWHMWLTGDFGPLRNADGTA